MIAETVVDIRTTRLGQLETVRVPESAVLSVPEGLPGFPEHRSFALLEDDQLAPFAWLQSLQDAEIGFLVLDPALFVADYDFELSDADAELLELSDPLDARVLSILVVPGEVQHMTANLQAPLVINSARRLAKQVILTDERWPLRYPVFGTAGAGG